MVGKEVCNVERKWREQNQGSRKERGKNAKKAELISDIINKEKYSETKIIFSSSLKILDLLALLT